jgi:hypothetical protein
MRFISFMTIVMFVCSGTIQAAEPAATQPVAEPPPAVVLTLAGDAPRVVAGQPVELMLHITNVSEQPVFLVGWGDFVDAYSKLVPAGRKDIKLWRNEELWRIADVRLDPGQTLKQRMTFGKWKDDLPEGLWHLEGRLLWSWGRADVESMFKWTWHTVPIMFDVRIRTPDAKPATATAIRPAVDASADENGVELALSAAPWAPAEGPVPFSCILRNEDYQTLSLSRAVPRGRAPRPWFDVRVLDEQGRAIEFTQQGNRALLSSRGSLVKIESLDVMAGQEFRQDYDLAQWFVFPGPGTYTVRVSVGGSQIPPDPAALGPLAPPKGMEHLSRGAKPIRLALSAETLIRITAGPDN